MILKIVIVALITIFLSSSLKSINSEISSMVSVCGGLIIFLLVVGELSNIILSLGEIVNLSNLDSGVISLALKIIGVGYITEFASDVAEDFGNKTLSSKVILGGKQKW